MGQEKDTATMIVMCANRSVMPINGVRIPSAPPVRNARTALRPAARMVRGTKIRINTGRKAAQMVLGNLGGQTQTVIARTAPTATVRTRTAPTATQMLKRPGMGSRMATQMVPECPIRIARTAPTATARTPIAPTAIRTARTATPNPMRPAMGNRTGTQMVPEGPIQIAQTVIARTAQTATRTAPTVIANAKEANLLNRTY